MPAEPSSTVCAAGVARCQSKKCTFRWKSCRIVQWWSLHGLCCGATLAPGRCVGQCEGIRKPVHQRGRDRHDTDSIDDERQGRIRLDARARTNAKASIHRSHHGGVKPLGARSLVRREATPPGQVAQTEAEKVRRRETRSRRRTNEARVLEIEAVDGRSRSHASRDWSAHHRKVAGVNQALVESLRGTTA